MAEGTQGSVTRPGPIHSRASSFTKVWAATTVSSLGTAVTELALPLTAIYELHASAFEVGVVSAAGVAAWLLIGLPAGVLVHRMPLRSGLLAADIARALAVLSVPVAAWTGVLTLAQLIGAALIVGIFSVLFDVGFATYLPSVVAREELTSRNSLLQGSESVSQVAGPAIGGVLVQVMGAATSLLVDVASYVFSAFCLLALPRVDDDTPPPPGRLLPQIKQGVGFVRRDPLVGPMTLAATALNFTGAAVGALSALFLVRTLHLAAWVVGLLLASVGLGGVIGAAIAPKAVIRLGSARTSVWAIVLAPAFALLIPLTTRGPGLALFIVGNLGLAAATVTFSVIARTHRQVAVPRELLARVMATVRFVSWGILPIAGLIAGALGEWLGVRAALGVTCALLLLGPVPILRSPARRLRNLDELPLGNRVSG